MGASGGIQIEKVSWLLPLLRELHVGTATSSPTRERFRRL